MTSASGWARVAAAVDQVLREHAVPGMVVAIARADEAPEHLVAGADGTGRPLAADSLFPVASLTKLAVALAVLRLADTGRLSVDDPLARHVPEAAAAQPGVTLRRLLTHTSGLRGVYPEALAPWTPDLTWATIRRAVLTVPLDHPPATRVEYGALNYQLLAIVLERVTGQAFTAVLQELVLTPLGIEGYLGAEPPRPPATIAGRPTDRYTGTGLEPFNSPFWRAVPQPNGNLVATAAGLVALLRAYHGESAGFLAPETADQATRDQTGGLAGGVAGWFAGRPCPWGLGPMLYGPCPWIPTTASTRSFGHTGMTSILAWLDPQAAVVLVLCATRFGFDGWCDRAYPFLGDAIMSALR
ncbi:MAG: beta-lactamase family protein [Actinomycetota bacterium]|nr:beta-lactamase family protein [Actinomycetota bacterium]